MQSPGITVLLIEDSPANARLIEIMLSQVPGTDFTIERAGRLDDGIGRLARSGIDVVLLDLGLPDSQGLGTFARLHGRAPGMPVVVLTGLEDTEVGLSAVRSGAQDYLVKGQATGELLARTIRYAIERHRFEEVRKKEDALRRTNQELRELDRMKSAFIDLTSHELRTPVATLAGMLRLLERRWVADDPKLAEALHAALRVAARLERLVGRILELTHTGAYDRHLDVTPTPVNELIGHVVAHVTPFLDLRKQKLVVDVPEGLAPVQMDPDKMEDVLLNLMMNAIKFTPDEGEITIRARRRDPNTMEFSVSDTGAGIPQADRPHIFDGLFTSYDTLGHASGEFEFGTRGIGVGLAIARRFVTMHGGTIGVDSEPGKGSTFTITLPMTGGPPA